MAGKLRDAVQFTLGNGSPEEFAERQAVQNGIAFLLGHAAAVWLQSASFRLWSRRSGKQGTESDPAQDTSSSRLLKEKLSQHFTVKRRSSDSSETLRIEL